MEEERKQKVALFRYGIISRLKGQRENRTFNKDYPNAISPSYS
jgi:hypothetical protein